MEIAPPYRFEGFELNPQTRQLHAADGEDVPLTPKAFDTLLFLLQQRDRVVGKEELLAHVWRGRIVEENNLTQAVSAIRRALGVGAGDHRYVVTVPGLGYRFIAPLQEAAVTGHADAVLPIVEPASWPVMPDRRRPTGSQPLRWLGLLLAVAALAVSWQWRQRTSPAPPRPLAQLSANATLAVLPFKPLSARVRDDLLGLGIADTLISRIGNSTNLRVQSLASSQAFIKGELDPLEAGRQLGADYVLEGSTQQSGDTVRVAARLRAVRDGTVLWSESFDERMDRVFTLQDRIAAALENTLRIQFSVGGSSSPCDGANVEAYRAYLTGQYALNRPSANSMREALAAFDRAIDLDPTCARAYAGAAFAHRALVMVDDRAPNGEFPLAKAAVKRALELNPNLAEAYASLGFIQFWYDWDWAGSEASFKRAISLNPSLAEAHFGYAHLLRNIGRGREAAEQARQAIALDPLSPLIGTLGSLFVMAGGQPEEGRRMLDGVVERNPQFWTAWLIHGQLQLRNGNKDAALVELERATRLCAGCSQALSALANAQALSGQPDAARQALARMRATRTARYLPATSLALVSVALGESGHALDLLEQGFQERDVRMTFLMSDAGWNSLRGQPRFEALIRRMKFPEPPPDQLLQVTDSAHVRGAP